MLLPIMMGFIKNSFPFSPFDDRLSVSITSADGKRCMEGERYEYRGGLKEIIIDKNGAFPLEVELRSQKYVM
jgi:hypothetical protein